MDRHLQVTLTVHRVSFCIYTDCVIAITAGQQGFRLKTLLRSCLNECEINESIRFDLRYPQRSPPKITIIFRDEIDEVGHASVDIRAIEEERDEITLELPIANQMDPNARVLLSLFLREMASRTPEPSGDVYRKVITEASESQYTTSPPESQHEQSRIVYPSYSMWRQSRVNGVQQKPRKETAHFQNMPPLPTWEDTLRKNRSPRSEKTKLVSPVKHYENKLKKVTPKESKQPPKRPESPMDPINENQYLQKLATKNAKLKAHIEQLEREKMIYKFKLADLEIEMQKVDLVNDQPDQVYAPPKFNQQYSFQPDSEQTVINPVPQPLRVEALQKQATMRESNDIQKSIRVLEEEKWKLQQQEYESKLESQARLLQQYESDMQGLRQNEQSCLSKVDEMERLLDAKTKDYEQLANMSSGSVKTHIVPLQQENQAYMTLVARMSEEQKQLSLQVQRLEVQCESLTKELAITRVPATINPKDIAELAETRDKALEDQVFHLQDQLREVKQTLGDTLNLVFEFGGSKLVEQIQASMAFRQMVSQ